MNIAPISSNNNQVFQCKGGKAFAKKLKNFCGKVLDRMEGSTSRVAEARMSLLNPIKNNSSYPKKRIY